MAASTGAVSAAASDPQGPASAGPGLDVSTVQYSMVLDHLIGDKRPIKDLSPGVMGGLPVPAKSDEQKMIERGMESCAFKSVLACVGGTDTYIMNALHSPSALLRTCVCLYTRPVSGDSF